jgi:hypothetical protein
VPTFRLPLMEWELNEKAAAFTRLTFIPCLPIHQFSVMLDN